jgi:hypothetical protein
MGFGGTAQQLEGHPHQQPGLAHQVDLLGCLDLEVAVEQAHQ